MRISTFFYTIKQGIVNIWKNKLFSLASIATMTACIFLFGLFYMIVVNFQSMVKDAESGVAVTVLFDEEKYVTYSQGELDELELAYAITIHKSQGSEYPAVVLPLLAGPRPLMNRNILYTAVTRGKKCVTIVGSRETVQNMIKNQSEQLRYSSLAGRIQEIEGK